MLKKSTFLLVLVTGLVVASQAMAAEGVKDLSGRSIAFDNKKGNCLSCHAIPNDPKAESPGNLAPPFIVMKDRFPSRDKLRAQIWDATQANPRTAMPPFGKHKILTEQEIDQVVEYIQSL